jgi:hypothetical protein
MDASYIRYVRTLHAYIGTLWPHIIIYYYIISSTLRTQYSTEEEYVAYVT